MTIPRLELKAAVLAARLLSPIAKELAVPIEQCFAWSDAQIVLQWIHSAEPTGNALIDNHVGHVHELLPSSVWRHVPTLTNPADVASRGIDAARLASHPLWWHGPTWLPQPAGAWPSSDLGRRHSSPEDIGRATACCVVQADLSAFMERFSDLTRLLRFLVRLRRWIQNRRAPGHGFPVLAPMDATGLRDAFSACVRLSQSRTFAPEIRELRLGRQLPAKHPMRPLDVFLDAEGLLRVGGRLHAAPLPYSERHPPVLSKTCHLAELVIAWAHCRALHGGFRSTYAYSMQRAWIVGGQRRIRAFLRRCVSCARLRARPMTQIMAALPRARVTPSRAFSHAGLDYAGPVRVLASKGRGTRTTKGYIAVFVCLATKALHLELVGDLTTQSLLGALARFYGRRGKPAEIWSDNATHFHRADIELRDALRQAEIDWDLVAGALAELSIAWRFIPPGAPHFGGLWEAGVKSVKAHLKRVVGPRHLTFEELTTLLVAIEAILNGRPLTPLTGEIDDVDVLTPGHFLVGGPLTAVPDPGPGSTNLNSLAHWELVRGLRDAFWGRWSLEYLNTLQQRCKWTERRANLEVGDLVVIVDPSLLSASGRWPLARVARIHPGRDGLVRVATVRTATGEYVRPITKLVPIPVTSPTPDDHADED